MQTAKKTKMTFDQWFAAVDKLVQAKCFLSVQDLPDCPYMAWYEAGKSVKSAASAALKRAGE